MAPYSWPQPEAAAVFEGHLRETLDSTMLRPWFGRWIAALAGLSGMSDDELGRRLGVTQSAVTRLRAAEADGRITIRKLTEVAESLDADLVYALVPKAGFAEQCAQRRASMESQRLQHRRMKLRQRRRLPSWNRSKREAPRVEPHGSDQTLS